MSTTLGYKSKNGWSLNDIFRITGMSRKKIETFKAFAKGKNMRRSHRTKTDTNVLGVFRGGFQWKKDGFSNTYGFYLHYERFLKNRTANNVADMQKNAHGAFAVLLKGMVSLILLARHRNDAPGVWKTHAELICKAYQRASEKKKNDKSLIESATESIKNASDRKLLEMFLKDVDRAILVSANAVNQLDEFTKKNESIIKTAWICKDSTKSRRVTLCETI